ncbi:MAG: GNAT family N-acetyltransferase [Anaerolineaceae bacterium]|nr:GNAT family N-acetyltransferase [Anaerolineaceae bacterium]
MILKQNILSTIEIRSMIQTDLPALEWDGTYTHYRELFKSTYQRVADQKGLAWLVEVPEKEIIGQVFIQLICQRLELADGITRAYLYSFRVKPKYRRLGIGKTLLDYCENDLIKRNIRFVTLNVSKDNELAIKLYKNRGYEIIASEPGIWQYRDHQGVRHQVIEPAWRMEKVLFEQSAI